MPITAAIPQAGIAATQKKGCFGRINKQSNLKSKVISMKSRVILIVLISVAAVILIGLGIMRGNLFNVKNIEIECEDISPEDAEYINQSSGVKNGQNIFNINTEAVENAINATGEYYVQDIMLIYPSTVRITVVKRVPTAVIEYENAFIITDSSCCVIKSTSDVSEYDLIRFTGIRISQYQIGSQINTKDEYQKSVIRTIVDTLLNNGTYDIISTVSLEDLSNVYLICKNGKRIDLCEAVDVAKKLEWLTEDTLQNAIFDDEEHTITLYSSYFVIK